MMAVECGTSKIESLTSVVGFSALAFHGLVNGYDCLCKLAQCSAMDGVCINGVKYEWYHIHDKNNFILIVGNKEYPTAERAIVDCILWQHRNYDEGFLIEALQSYQQQGHNVEDLYEVADFYKLDRRAVDYWWKEAEEDSEMSMG